MDRIIAYADELLLDTDLLKFNRNAMIGIAKLAEGILGTSTLIDNLLCTPTDPASMSVTVKPGEIYQMLPIDATAYGSLPADTTHQILKQGIVLDSQTFSCPAPPLPDTSVNYLIEVTLIEQDTDSAVRGFYNTGTPTGLPVVDMTENQTRQDLCFVKLVAGFPNISGTQLTPSPDPGYVGAWVITVAFDQESIEQVDISEYPSAPFIRNKLNDCLTEVTGDARYGQKRNIQANIFNYDVDFGTANNYGVTLNPAPTSLSDGMIVWMKARNSNTGASTLNVNGLGAVAIYKMANSSTSVALSANDILADGQYQLIFNAVLNEWILKDPSTDNFNGLMSGNGYVILPNGLIMQWGTGAAMGQNNSQAITFPVAFPNQAFRVIVGTETTVHSGVTVTPATYTTGTLTTTGFSCYFGQNGAGAGSTVTPNYYAIGH